MRIVQLNLHVVIASFFTANILQYVQAAELAWKELPMPRGQSITDMKIDPKSQKLYGLSDSGKLYRMSFLTSQNWERVLGHKGLLSLAAVCGDQLYGNTFWKHRRVQANLTLSPRKCNASALPAVKSKTINIKSDSWVSGVVNDCTTICEHISSGSELTSIHACYAQGEKTWKKIQYPKTVFELIEFDVFNGFTAAVVGDVEFNYGVSFRKSDWPAGSWKNVSVPADINMMTSLSFDRHCEQGRVCGIDDQVYCASLSDSEPAFTEKAAFPDFPKPTEDVSWLVEEVLPYKDLFFILASRDSDLGITTYHLYLSNTTI